MAKKLLVCLIIVNIATIAAAQEMAAYSVGDYKVYILTEGGGEADKDLLIDAPANVISTYAPDGTFPIATHAVLIKGKGKIWLVDTGNGKKILENLNELGIKSTDVDHVLLTHMHGDHIGSMLSEGKPTFPNAAVTLDKKEVAYWTSETEMNKFPLDRRNGFNAAQEMLRQYGEKVEQVVASSLDGIHDDGIFPIEAYGHTPGHIMYLISSGGEKMLIWGDLTHALAIQMPHPEISVKYDINPDMARETRLKVLEYISDKDIVVIGMHVPAIQPGKIVKDEASGGYRYDSIRK